MLNNILKHKLKTILKYLWKCCEPTFRPTRVQPHILPRNQSPSPPKHFIFPFRKIVAHILFFFIFPFRRISKIHKKTKPNQNHRKLSVLWVMSIRVACVKELTFLEIMNIPSPPPPLSLLTPLPRSPIPPPPQGEGWGGFGCGCGLWGWVEGGRGEGWRGGGGGDGGEIWFVRNCEESFYTFNCKKLWQIAIMFFIRLYHDHKWEIVIFTPPESAAFALYEGQRNNRAQPYIYPRNMTPASQVSHAILRVWHASPKLPKIN